MSSRFQNFGKGCCCTYPSRHRAQRGGRRRWPVGISAYWAQKARILLAASVRSSLSWTHVPTAHDSRSHQCWLAAAASQEKRAIAAQRLINTAAPPNEAEMMGKGSITSFLPLPIEQVELPLSRFTMLRKSNIWEPVCIPCGPRMGNTGLRLKN